MDKNEKLLVLGTVGALALIIYLKGRKGSQVNSTTYNVRTTYAPSSANTNPTARRTVVLKPLPKGTPQGKGPRKAKATPAKRATPPRMPPTVARPSITIDETKGKRHTARTHVIPRPAFGRHYLRPVAEPAVMPREPLGPRRLREAVISEPRLLY